MDYNKIKEAAQNYEADMTKFLRELVHFPGESCGEKDHVMRIKEEMEKLGFDKVEIDPMGNILGYMGTGSTALAARQNGRNYLGAEIAPEHFKTIQKRLSEQEV